MSKSFTPLMGIMIACALVMLVRPGAANALQGDTVLAATLSGAEEAPDPGDTDGAGTATVVLRSASSEVCWELTASNITLPAAAAHIHEGARGVAGPVVVPLSAPDVTGAATGCVTADGALMTRIMEAPANFYVNVHTSDFPAGAVRGQLATSPAAEGGPAQPPAAPSMPNAGADAGRWLALVGFALTMGAAGLGLRIAGRRRTTSH